MRRCNRLLLLGLLSASLLSGCKFGDASGSGTDTSAVPASNPADNPTPPPASSGPPKGLPAEPAPPPPGNTVNATSSEGGTVSVAVGARKTISVAFTSSDGLPVSGFALSGTTLPLGWSGPEVFTCTAAGTGNDCVLNLTYAPAAPDSGTLTLNYIYVDHAGVRRTPGGSLTIPYAATASNNIGASIAPSGQVKARLNAGTQSVSINFTTDDGNVATALVVSSDLSALPRDWKSGAANFACAIVTTGSGCQLVLDYTPTVAANDVLTLTYSYVDNAGGARTGAINFPYSTTADSSVEATVSPTGQINAVRNGGGQSVAVTFTTDDGRAASGLLVSSDLAALPAGWSSASNKFSCASVGTGNGCQLRLNYAPTDLTSGAFRLEYVYTSAAGTFKTGSLNIAYAATTDNNVAGTALPSGQINAIVGQGVQNVAINFTSDDGRPASALSMTSDLSSLPAGWSAAANSFACSEVAAGGGCQLNLTYAPTGADSGTVTLTYAYRNNAGRARTGSVNIPFRATTDDHVVGTPSRPTIALLTGESASVDVTFTTDDGNPAGILTIRSGLTPLPADWSGAAAFVCASVAADNGCKLTLGYAPTAPASGSVTLTFDYVNNAGIAKTGSTTITYSATTPPPPPPPI